MEDMMNYRTLNIMKVNYLKHIFKEVNDNTLDFGENHFNNYCFETSELFISICSLNKIKEEQLEGFTKKLFDSHLFQLIKELRTGIKFKVNISTLDNIISKFVLINFGSYISKQFIIESLIKDFDDNDLLNQFPSVKPYIELNSVPEILLDYSDTSGREKIIFLYKLGVLEFLKKRQPFILSTNKLAEYLSAITGEKTSTIQSYINPIYGKNVSLKNNPLESPKIVEKLEQKLINMGFNNTDFK